MPRFLLLLTLVAVLPVSAEEWTQWRGPTRDGRVASLPESLESLQLDWSVDFGPSYSGPIADAERVYTTETEDKKNEVVVALDRKTGDEVWRASWPGAMKVPFFAAANGSWIRATPALADGRLYVAGMKDLLVCLDAKTGDEVWRKDFVAEMGTPVPSFGYVASPLIRDGLVIVQAGGAVIGLDAVTGDVRWKTLETDGGMSSGSAFSSPIMCDDAPGGPQLLVQTRSTLAGVDPSNGTVLWSTPVEAFRGMNILTPTPRVVGNELQVFTSSYGGGSTMFAIAGGSGEVETKWTDKAQAYMSSPVTVGDRLVVHLRNQRTTAIDQTTGETAWTTTPYGKYWSMLTDGKNVLALDQRGDLLLIDPSGDEMTVLDSRKVSDEETWAHVGWDGQQLFVRRLEGLDVYSVK